MKICVLIKQVPDKDSPLAISDDHLSLSDNNIRFFFHNPESDKDMEEQARKDRIQPVQMQVIENDKVEINKVYL